MAGVLDSQGLFTLRWSRDTQLPVVALHAGQPGTHQVLAKMTGTRVTTVTRDYDRQPCSDHCVEAHSHVDSVTVRWSVTGSRATILLFNVMPYLRIQQGAAQDLLDHGQTVGWKSQVSESMERLGFKIPGLREQPRARRTAS